MKKTFILLGILFGIIYSCASAFYVYVVAREVQYGVSLINEYADFSIFTIKTYFEVFSPYVIYLLFCLPPFLFMLFYFFCIIKSKIANIIYSITALVWCLLIIVLLTIPDYITINIFSCTPSIPNSDGVVHIMFSRLPLNHFKYFFYATILMLLFLLGLNLKHILKQFHKRSVPTTSPAYQQPTRIQPAASDEC